LALFRAIFLVSLLAGGAAGLVMTGLQQLATVPLILKAEVYEQAVPEAADADTLAVGHQHEAGGDEHGHDHGDEGWKPADGWQRTLFTAAANVVTAVGFALVLVVASECAGGVVGWRSGLGWGLAGFVSFILAPGLGLPPELPAMPVADLVARQVWWLGTVASTAGALALLVFARRLPLAVIAILLLLAPHLIGAPQAPSVESPIPEALHHQFMIAVMATGLVFWSVLGAVAGWLRPRFFAADGLAIAA
jgi:cobalt transporter subunit CbtA